MPDLGLRDVLGATALGHVTGYRNFNYLRFIRRHPLRAAIELSLIPAPAEGLDVRPLRGATVLARFLRPMEGRYVSLSKPGLPALILNRFGRGHCLFMAGTFGETYFAYNMPEYRKLVENAVRRFARLPVELEMAAAPVEVVARRQAGRMLVHLVNHCSFDQRPLERVETLRQLALRVRLPGARRARSLALERPLAIESVAGGVRVKLPELKAYDVIVVE